MNLNPGIESESVQILTQSYADIKTSCQTTSGSGRHDSFDFLIFLSFDIFLQHRLLLKARTGAVWTLNKCGNIDYTCLLFLVNLCDYFDFNFFAGKFPCDMAENENVQDSNVICEQCFKCITNSSEYYKCLECPAPFYLCDTCFTTTRKETWEPEEGGTGTYSFTKAHHIHRFTIVFTHIWTPSKKKYIFN